MISEMIEDGRLPARAIAAFFALLLLCPAFCVHGQTSAQRGTIRGSVTDAQGKRVSGAHVSILNSDTHQTRSVDTNGSGNFLCGSLLPGAYVVEIHSTSMALKKPLRVNLNVGGSMDVEAVLAPVARASVRVNARGALVEGNTTAPAANRENSELTTWIAGTSVTYLPNQNRSFTDLATLAATVQDEADQAGLVISGQKAANAAVIVDGSNATNALEPDDPNLKQSYLLPETVVREVQVIHAGVNALIGNTAAGVINVATKRGTDKFRGEAFYIFRPSQFTSRDTFGNSVGTRQNSFGASAGRSLWQRRLYSYAGFEQSFLDTPAWTEFAPQLGQIPVALSTLQVETVSRMNATSAFMNMDVNLNARNSFQLEYGFNRLAGTNFAGPSIGGISTRILGSPDQLSGLQAMSHRFSAVFSSTIADRGVNQLAVNYGHISSSLSPNSPSPELAINGFGNMGGDSLSPHAYWSGRREVNDELTEAAGRGSLTLGIDYADLPGFDNHEANLNGRFDYSALADYLAATPRRYQQTLLLNHTAYSAAVHLLAVYGQAKITFANRLTVDLGIRWDGQWNPQPSSPNPSFPTTMRVPGDLLQFQPRLGLAWSVSYKTTIRLSSGLYDVPTPADLFARAFTDNGTHTVVADSYFDPQILGLAESPTPHALSAPPSGLTTPQALVVGIDPAFRNPRSFQAAASAECTFHQSVDVVAGFQRSSTWRLPARLDENLPPPVIDLSGLPVFPGTRPLSNVGRLLVNRSLAHSSYNGFFATATAAISRRSQLVANYTLGSTRDDDSLGNPFDEDMTLNPFHLGGERAFSTLDIRQNLNLGAVLNLPLDIKVNPILHSHSGLPYTPVIGFDIQGDANDANDRAMRNGLVLPRNIYREPAFNTFDLRIVKDITLKGEGHHLDLFLDCFNILGAGNRTFGPQQTSVFGLESAPFVTAGVPVYAPSTAANGGARQIQFTARLVAF